MPASIHRTNLGDWQNEPIVQDEVIAYMDQIGAPMLRWEIYHPLRLPRYTFNRVLARLPALRMPWPVPSCCTDQPRITGPGRGSGIGGWGRR
jgi:hypothetical protein